MTKPKDNPQDSPQKSSRDSWMDEPVTPEELARAKASAMEHREYLQAMHRGEVKRVNLEEFDKRTRRFISGILGSSDPALLDKSLMPGREKAKKPDSQ